VLPSSTPPLALTYLRSLLGGRGDIAVHPVDAFDHDYPPDHFYLYRPAEVLVPEAHAATFAAAASRLRLDHTLIGRAPHPRHGLHRYRLETDAPHDRILGDLVGAAGDPLEVAPNHVILTCPRWALSPDGDPHVASELTAPDRDGEDWDVTVAIIDGGLPEGYGVNPLLRTVVAEPGDQELWPYAGSQPELTYPQGHGAFVAGIVHRHAPRVRVRAYSATDRDGVIDEWDLGRQVDEVLADRPDVINLSLGSPSRHDESLLGLRRLAAAASAEDGPIVVAAAGNMAQDRHFWPAAEPWAIAVGAAEATGDERPPARAEFSGYGDWVDVCALGVDVVSSYEARPYRAADGQVRHFHGAAIWSGTSFAAPRVAAAVARLRAAHPGLSREKVLRRFQSEKGAPTIAGIGVYVS
jgi:subtilisin family serine protease